MESMKNPAVVSRKKLVLGFLFIAAMTALYFWKLPREMADFEVFYRAGQRCLAGEQLYTAADGHYQFKYPPFFAVVMAPLALLPHAAARLLWFWLVLAALAGMFMLALRLLFKRRERRWLLVLVPLLVLGRFYARELNLGQANALLNVLLLAAIALLMAGRDWLAGLTFSLAAVVKPYALIFLPYLAWRRKLQAVLASLAGLALSLLAPGLFYGWAGNIGLLHSWRATLAQSSIALFDSFDNTSLTGMLSKWLGSNEFGRLAPPLLALAGLLYAALLFSPRRVPKQQAVLFDSAALLILIPLYSPLGWDYTFLSATLGVMILADRFAVQPLWARAAALAAMVLVGGLLYDVWGRALFLRLQSWSVITPAFVLLFLLLLNLKRLPAAE